MADGIRFCNQANASLQDLTPLTPVARQTLRLLHAAAGNLGPAVIDQGRISLLTTGDARILEAAARRWLALHEPVDLL